MYLPPWFHMQPDTIFGADGEMGHWGCGAVWDGGKLECGAQARQQQRAFHHRKPRPRAGPGSHGKRHIGVAGASLAVFGAPTIGIKVIGAVPQPRVAVQIPGAKDDL